MQNVEAGRPNQSTWSEIGKNTGILRMLVTELESGVSSTWYL